jgi:hypothetical protein
MAALSFLGSLGIPLRGHQLKFRIRRDCGLAPGGSPSWHPRKPYVTQPQKTQSGRGILGRTLLLLLRVANQDNVGVSMPADHRQFAPIRRPVVVPDMFGLERSELLARRAFQRLLP